MTDPLRPMPMSPEEIADLVERARQADAADISADRAARGRFRKGNRLWTKRTGS